MFAVILRVSLNICGMNRQTGKEKPKLLLIPLIAEKFARLIVQYRELRMAEIAIMHMMKFKLQYRRKDFQ